MPVEDYNNDFMGATGLDNNDRVNTATEIRPNPNNMDFLGAPNNNNDNGFGQSAVTEKPKVQIKPYKFSFD